MHIGLALLPIAGASLEHLIDRQQGSSALLQGRVEIAARLGCRALLLGSATLLGSKFMHRGVAVLGVATVIPFATRVWTSDGYPPLRKVDTLFTFAFIASLAGFAAIKGEQLRAAGLIAGGAILLLNLRQPEVQRPPDLDVGPVVLSNEQLLSALMSESLTEVEFSRLLMPLQKALASEVWDAKQLSGLFARLSVNSDQLSEGYRKLLAALTEKQVSLMLPHLVLERQFPVVLRDLILYRENVQTTIQRSSEAVRRQAVKTVALLFEQRHRTLSKQPPLNGSEMQWPATASFEGQQRLVRTYFDLALNGAPEAPLPEVMLLSGNFSTYCHNWQLLTECILSDLAWAETIPEMDGMVIRRLQVTIEAKTGKLLRLELPMTNGRHFGGDAIPAESCSFSLNYQDFAHSVSHGHRFMIGPIIWAGLKEKVKTIAGLSEQGARVLEETLLFYSSDVYRRLVSVTKKINIPEFGRQADLSLSALGEDRTAYSDLTLQVGDAKLEVHRIVLSQCGAFEPMVAGPFVEGKQDLIELKETSSDAMRLLLNWIYTGSDSSVSPLLKQTAAKYNVSLEAPLSRSQFWGGDRPYEQFSDVTFQLSPEMAIKAHKCIVVPLCRRLESMVQQSNGVVQVEGMSPELFQALLKYLYTAELPDDSVLIGQLLWMADEWEMQELKEHCQAAYLDCQEVGTERGLIGLSLLAEATDAALLEVVSAMLLKQNSNAQKWLSAMKSLDQFPKNSD